MASRTIRNLGPALLIALALAVGGGCGGDEGGATGAVCPTGSTLTYDSFGRDFVETYCTGCHASTVAGPDRESAPVDVNFDTLEGIREFADEIDVEAAAGPDATNTAMPEGDGDEPSAAEREMLGEWLACGAP